MRVPNIGLRWHFHRASEWPELAHIWDGVNAEAGGLPFLETAFLAPLLDQFARGDGIGCARASRRSRGRSGAVEPHRCWAGRHVSAIATATRALAGGAGRGRHGGGAKPAGALASIESGPWPDPARPAFAGAAGRWPMLDHTRLHRDRLGRCGRAVRDILGGSRQEPAHQHAQAAQQARERWHHASVRHRHRGCRRRRGHCRIWPPRDRRVEGRHGHCRASRQRPGSLLQRNDAQLLLDGPRPHLAAEVRRHGGRNGSVHRSRRHTGGAQDSLRP